MNDNDVREMLERRAGQATVSSDAWDRIAERIAEDGTGPTVLAFAPPRRRFNAAIVLGAIAAALLVLVASVAVIQSRDTAEKVRAADDGTSLPPVPDREPESGPPAAVTGLGQRPVWPATTDEGLARLQAEADAGQRPDLLDPRAVAGGYLSERFSDDAARRLAQNFAVDEFAEGDSTSGEVPYTSPPAPPPAVPSWSAGPEGTAPSGSWWARSPAAWTSRWQPTTARS